MPCKNLKPEFDVKELSCLIDLHLHLDGSLSLNAVKKLAKMQNMQIPKTDDELTKLLSVTPNCKNLNEYLEKFDFPCSLLQTADALTFAVSNLLKELNEQGVMYAEIRFAPQKHTLKGLTQQQVVEAAVKGLNNSPIGCGLILCCMRDNNNHAENIETINVAKQFLGGGVVAVDLAGAEALFPTKSFEDLFVLAKENNVPFTIHAGEADGVESVKSVLSFGAKRVGHGVRSIESEELLQLIKQNDVTLECCPTSNLNTQVFDSIKKFPVNQFLKHGIRFTINTDNMAVSATNLKHELGLIVKTFDLTKNQLKQILFNAVDALFLCDNKKCALKQNIEKQL